MPWEKLVEREGDFLKNYLLYEGFTENFPKVFGKDHSDHLTIRDGDKFTHYIHKEKAKELSLFIKNQLNKNPNFIREVVIKGKEHFNNLTDFSQIINKKKLEDLENKQIKELIAEYFRLYKEPYPYFNLSVFIDEQHNKEIIELMSELRLFVRTNYNQVHKLIEPLFIEISNRFNLSVNDLKFLTSKEIIDLFSIEDKIKNRQNCYFKLENGKFKLHENKILTIKENLSDQIKGKGTFPAVYKGHVKIIKNKKDFQKINQGDVIVTRMTTPDILTENIRKAGAIITDEGGITCHAAILSRELKIPALIGTKNATSILKDNDLVEIDTKKGTITKTNPNQKP